MKPPASRWPAAVILAPILLALAAEVRGEDVPRIQAVRFWSSADVTRVAIETTDEVEYRAERIDSPDRLFLDLVGARRLPGRRGIETLPVGDRLLKQIRIAETQPGTVRVVLDLAAALDFSVSQLRNPDRLIVELRQARPPAIVEPGTMPAGPAVTLPVSTAPPPPAAAPPRAAVKEPAPLPEPPRLAPRTELKPMPPEVATAAKRDSLGGRSLIRALGLKLQRVVLDPGHGGHDTGTIGPGGLQEKALVLDVARRLGLLIADRLGSEVSFTREDDTFVPLEIRAQMARDRHADLFLSIHANSSRSRGITGPETFYLNLTRDADALEVAARENATSQKSIAELQTLIEKITLKTNVHESREFAESIQKALHGNLSRGKPVMKNRGVKKAPFVVLAEASMPSVLVEVAFLSNPRDENLLKRPEYRQRIAEALFGGVAQYAESLSHYPQVARGR